MTVLPPFWPISFSKSFCANFILIAHFAWASWMIIGAALALLGWRWHRLWRWRVFRITHLIGILATATTPFWANGICPMTEWEWQLRYASGAQTGTGESESFIIHWLDKILFLDIDPLVLSIVTALLALSTLVIFIVRPPWRDYP